MKLIFTRILAALTIFPAIVTSIVPPGASTPEFYLVSSSETASANLLPVHLDGTLDGTAPVAILYFYHGSLVGAPSTPGAANYIPYIESTLVNGDQCSTYGALEFTQGSSTDKCAIYNTFQIQSDNENSQIGAQLVLNYQGSFYSCPNGATQQVFYKVSPGDGPNGCSPISLYTVPVV